MKDFLIHILASVICAVVLFPIVHWLFVLFGWSDPEPILSTISYAAGFGLFWGIVTGIYNKFKKK